MNDAGNNTGQRSASGGHGGRRRRHRHHHGGGQRDSQGAAGEQRDNRAGGPRPTSGGQKAGPSAQRGASAEHRNRQFQSSNSRRRSGGRPLTANQVLVKYDNLLEQHLITRRKYYEYFNRVDDRQLRRLEKNFYTSVEHLRRFEANLEPWQREALEKRKTERYRLDLTYSQNHNIDLTLPPPIEVAPDEIEDPHFKESQKEAFKEYENDTEESVGTFEDYLKLKGLT